MATLSLDEWMMDSTDLPASTGSFEATPPSMAYGLGGGDGDQRTRAGGAWEGQSSAALLGADLGAGYSKTEADLSPGISAPPGPLSSPLAENAEPATLGRNDSGRDNLTGLQDGAAILLDLGDSPQTAQTVSGRLEASDYANPTRLDTFKDDYLLTSAINTSVRLSLDSSDFNAYLQVVDTVTGEVLAFDDDGGQGTNSQLSLSLQAGSQYLLRATSTGAAELGLYSLTILREITPLPNPQPPSTLSSPGRFNSASGYGLVDAASAVATAINQPRFKAVANIGGTQWNNDMVNAPEVWARGYTGQGVTVAVIDSGVDINHEDLRSNIWVNSGEIVGDGIDNDGNGYVDDYNGWNFGRGQNNNNVLPGTNDPGQGHGTHVAGTVAAANNGIGMTGVAHNAKIMAIRMGDVAGNSFVNAGNLAQAIRYAVDNGAQVINMSLGWSDPDGSVRDALAYAASRNVIAVSASGNSGQSAPGSPARYATAYGLSVGAVDRNERIASFSNRAGSDSRMLHVMAPGQEIYSTLPGNAYGNQQGTSMAAPHVAGVVALMLSANPDLTHSQVRAILARRSTAASASSPSTDPSPEPGQASLNRFGPTILAGAQPWSLDLPATTEQPPLANQDDPSLPDSLSLDSLSLSSVDLAQIVQGRTARATGFSSTDDWLSPVQSVLKDDLLAPALV